MQVDNNNQFNPRTLFKSLSHTQTQLVQSTEISSACMCPYLFKLSYPFGVSRAQQDYIVADSVHDIFSLVCKDIIIEKWAYKCRDFENIAKHIQKESTSITESILSYKKEWAKGEGREIPSNFDDDVNDRIHGILIGLAKRIMYRFEKPKRSLTEITVTNIKNYQEGRIDAILEFENGQYGAIDWKAYNLDPVNGSGSEKWQLLANLLLLNYRYTGDEDNWSKCLFGSIVYYTNAYIPRFPIKEDTINKVKEGRNFSHETLCGRSPPVKKPQFCPVCDTGSSSVCNDCQFYRQDSNLAYSGKLPPNYEQLRKTFFRKRYMIMEERAETHRPKFVIGIMLDKMGEVPAIETLEKAGIIHTGYRLESSTKDKKETDNNNNVRSQKESHVTLIKDNFAVFLQPRKQIRLIIKEKGIPLLACASATGGVKEIDGKRLVVDFRTKTLANRAINILRGNNSYQYNCNNNVIQNKVKDEFPENEIIIIPDEINLTKRLLEPLHKFHKLAANILIPFEVAEILGLDNNSNNSRREIGGTSV
ncbi:MAG: hypothetical protein ACTHL3_06290 [Candidatus Nitrosocosmicus sp.]